MFSDCYPTCNIYIQMYHLLSKSKFFHQPPINILQQISITDITTTQKKRVKHRLLNLYHRNLVHHTLHNHSTSTRSPHSSTR